MQIQKFQIVISLEYLNLLHAFYVLNVFSKEIERSIQQIRINFNVIFIVRYQSIFYLIYIKSYKVIGGIWKLQNYT